MTVIAESHRRLDLDHPARPMLARDADSIYWMSRYVERAEHVARLLMVTSSLLGGVVYLVSGMPRPSVAEAEAVASGQ